MNFYNSLISGIIVSSFITYVPWFFYIKDRKKTLISSYIQASLHDIPEKNYSMSSKYFNLSNFKLKPRKRPQKYDHNRISDSERNVISQKIFSELNQRIGSYHTYFS